jgi:hypothetical protein
MLPVAAEEEPPGPALEPAALASAAMAQVVLQMAPAARRTLEVEVVEAVIKMCLAVLGPPALS